MGLLFDLLCMLCLGCFRYCLFARDLVVRWICCCCLMFVGLRLVAFVVGLLWVFRVACLVDFGFMIRWCLGGWACWLRLLAVVYFGVFAFAVLI